jgi:hypothetical protein
MNKQTTDWFEALTGFQERSYEDTREKLRIEGRQLRSLVNNKSYAVGTLEVVSLGTLRERAKGSGGSPGSLRVSIATGDVGLMHGVPENAGALFQVASQFNLLEMTGPEITPEHGVTRYQYDRTQGPACAIAAGAATIYRNYFAPIGGNEGQTSHRQFNGLANVGQAFSAALELPIEFFWKMQNGYALCTRPGLEAIAEYLQSLNFETLNALRDRLLIGIHSDVEVTNHIREPRPLVSQAFCSALPISYCHFASPHWEPFARLVLEAAYEATMWAAAINAASRRSDTVLLTLLGGGAFGNNDKWIYDSIRRALEIMIRFNLQVKLVSFGQPPGAMVDLVRRFS